jgi:hypothetical protein
MLSVRKSVKRLTDRFLLPEEATISGINLCRKFKPSPKGSLKALLTLMNQEADLARPTGGSTHPYYRRRIPAPQDGVSVIVKIQLGNSQVTLVDGNTAGIHVGSYIAGFGIPPDTKVNAVDTTTTPPALTLSQAAGVSGNTMTFIGKYDYFSSGRHIDLRKVALAPYPKIIVSSTEWLNAAIAGFDARAAAAILDAADPTIKLLAGDPAHNLLNATKYNLDSTFLEVPNNKDYPGIPRFHTLSSTSLAMMAYGDFFPSDIAPDRSGQRTGDYLRELVKGGIMIAAPGYCGSFGPGVDGATSLQASEGNYDMTQTHLIPLAYSFYDELTNDAREHLIRRLLAGGIIHRPNESDITTSGPLPDDWARAGYVALTDPISSWGFGSVKDIGETENHIISMLSTRYLTNQLLYQRDPKPDYDNRRNAKAGPTCMSLVLSELQNILRCDFSEYNAKSYQEETRWPILNLATYAYDHEVRLAARMVLDYISARIALSSNDLRRIVPFRRRNEGINVMQDNGVMIVGLLEWTLGADPMSPYFAIQAGSVRAYETPNLDANDFYMGPPARPWALGIAVDGCDVTKEVLSAYRLPLPIHDLFVNDSHRRFYQRLHRTDQKKEAEHSRNCDNFELYASSPSYLITAGGQPAQWAIDPTFLGKVWGNQLQQIGVAMPTTFMATGQSAGLERQNSAADLIQFSHFSDDFNYNGLNIPEYLNYGVAPDFACGHDLYLPPWAQGKLDQKPLYEPGFHFINCGADGTPAQNTGRPVVAPFAQYSEAGFYLAIYKDGPFALLEAFDTWLHPDVTFESFQNTVQAQNGGINLNAHDGSGNQLKDQGGIYTTFYGTKIEFSIWLDHTSLPSPDSKAGARIKSIVYSQTQHPTDSEGSMGDAGNVSGPFLNGTILNSPRDAVVEITNPLYEPEGAKIILDMYDLTHPRRISETGEVEQAGFYNEVWVNFGWTGPTEGDFFHPFNTLTAAVNAVADGGVVKVVPGWTTERPAFVGKKRCKIVAPIGGVRIGVR